MAKAGFFRRFFAVFIDGLLLSPINYFLMPSVSADPVTMNGASFLITVIYEAVLISMWNGQTIGKKILGVRITTASGGQVDFIHALIRPFAKILSTLVILLGYFWMLWDKDSQTWHDKIAGTVAAKV